jgi:hypothetical protein
MKSSNLTGLSALLLFLTGCATTIPQAPVAFSESSLRAEPGRIGVGMTALPKIETQLPGAFCLLCIAAARAANSALSSHAETLSYENLLDIKQDVANLLTKKGATVAVIGEELKVDELPDFSTKTPGFARKDFSQWAAKYKIDKVLVIDITSLGFVRTYSAYFPTSDPKSHFNGLGYIVNLKSNAYEWYHPVSIVKATDQNWDEPPKFPGLTNAYFQALELGKDSFLRPFASGIVSPAGAVPTDALARSVARDSTAVAK